MIFFNTHKHLFIRLGLILGGIFFVVCLVFLIMLFAPLGSGSSSNQKTITIEKNESFGSVTQDLKNQKLITSTFLFKVYVKLTSIDKSVVPGEYLFDKSSSLVQVAHRIAMGDFETEQPKIVVPEGSTVSDIASIISKTYPDFDQTDFIRQASAHEGYLFPDTYELFESTSTNDILEIFLKNFDVKTEALKNEALAEGKSWADIITMASILEEEGNTEDDRKIIAGILYKRIEQGIRLQVDSTFRYINGKTSKELTFDDLRINSPYNTYVNAGLPPGPISNPGLQSIEAALHPTETTHLYFLTGDDGNMYYADTFEQHVKNKENIK